jgi:magnesium chelatase family protein
MNIYAFEAIGFDGQLVKVEVDIRRGIPALDVVGLPDSAVREAGERVRAAIRNAGYQFPLDRILVNLAPAGLRKAGAAFDLAIAAAILLASGQLPQSGMDMLLLGELELSGTVRAVPGVMAAVAAGLAASIPCFLVPRENAEEARVLAGAAACQIGALAELALVFGRLLAGYAPKDSRVCDDADFGPGQAGPAGGDCGPYLEDMAELCGQAELKRALEIAAAGGHHVLLFGPPGAGKTMAARRMPGLLPPLEGADALVATKLHSLAGVLAPGSGLLSAAPFRTPHHSASAEGILGGGKLNRPGEISLAHGGILFLDEAPEFRSDVLQALREPLEEGFISIARADRTVRYPSSFLLVLACNPCPCGKLGRAGSVCLCSFHDIKRYWRRLGAALLDRIDIRVPVLPVHPGELGHRAGAGSAAIRERVKKARRIQRERYEGEAWSLNARLGPQGIQRYIRLNESLAATFAAAASADALSSRACHGILRVARTIADLSGEKDIDKSHIEEAMALRRYGEENLFWQLP